MSQSNNSETSNMPGIREILISAIERDDEIQPRVEMSDMTIEEYTETLRSGAKLPPVTIYRDPQTGVNRLVDGFHRVAAALALGREKVNAEIVKGDKREAILFSVGANAEHGQRRTNQDKRRAVGIMMTDPEWVKWSDHKIAEACKVSHNFVREHRPLASDASEPVVRTTKNGREMRTGNISASNRDRKPKPTPVEPDAFLSQVNGVASADPPEIAAKRANGKIPHNAVVTITEPEATTSLADVTEEIEEAAAIADDTSDETWVSGLPLFALLPSHLRKTFSIDAITYRTYQTATRTLCKHHASRLVKRGHPGEYGWRIRSFLSINDPSKWHICCKTEDGGCSGAGQLPGLGIQCIKCHGRGYFIGH